MTGLQKTGRVYPVRRSNRRFERFNAGLITKQFIEQIEPDSSPVDGWTGPTGRSGPVFKTMLIAAERSRLLPRLCTYSRGNAIDPYYRYSLVAPPILTLCHGQLLPFYIYIYIYSQNIIIKILVFSSYFKIINIF